VDPANSAACSKIHERTCDGCEIIITPGVKRREKKAQPWSRIKNETRHLPERRVFVRAYIIRTWKHSRTAFTDICASLYISPALRFRQAWRTISRIIIEKSTVITTTVSNATRLVENYSGASDRFIVRENWEENGFPFLFIYYNQIVSRKTALFTYTLGYFTDPPRFSNPDPWRSAY